MGVLGRLLRAKSIAIIIALSALVLVDIPNVAYAEAWVAGSGTCGTCSWRIVNDDGWWTLSIYPTNGTSGQLESPQDGSNLWPWHNWKTGTIKIHPEGGWLENIELIDSITIDEGVIACEDMTGCFSNFYGAQEWHITSLDTSKTISMRNMFYRCGGVDEIDFSLLDTTHVTDFGGMFHQCRSLREFDFGVLNTSSATNLSGMFESCGSLNTVMTSSCDTSHVTNFSYMFDGCYKLHDVDLSGFDTTSAQKMDEMFYGCAALTEIDLSSFDTPELKSCRYMMRGCANLTSIDLTPLDFRKADANGMLYDCTSLEEIVVGDKTCASLLDSIPYESGSKNEWWSKEEEAWIDWGEIQERVRIPDTYTKYENVEEWHEDIDLIAYGKANGKDKGTEVPVRCAWRDPWVSEPSTSYNHAMGTTLSILASAAYEETVARSDLRVLRCSPRNIECHFPDYFDYSDDINRVAYSFGIRKVPDSDIPIVFILVRGTPGNIEWESNFNMSDNTYPNKEHEGMSKATQFLFDDLKEFLKNKEVDLSQARFVITGHSRGAGVANLLGGWIDQGKLSNDTGKAERDRTYVYTFASPNVTSDSNMASSQYNNIFNIVNPEDTVPRVALSKWGFGKYGRTYVLPSKSNTTEYIAQLVNMKANFRKLTDGLDYVPYAIGSQASVGFADALASAAPTVKDLNTMKVEYYEGSWPTGYWEKTTLNKVIQSAVDLLGNNGAPVRTEPLIPYKRSIEAIVRYNTGLARKGLAVICDETLTDNFYGKLPSADFLHKYVNERDGYKRFRADIGDAFTHAHTTETYIAWMQACNGTFSDYYRGVAIACPVDIEVYDGEDSLVCRIVDDVVDADVRETGLAAYVEDGVKHIDVPDDGNYRFVVTPTDEGKMDVSCSAMSAEGVEQARVVYLDQALEEGQSYQISLPQTDDSQDRRIEMLDPNGDEVEPTRELGAGELGTCVVEAVVGSGDGVVDEHYSVTWGETITVRAHPEEDGTFIGWYENGKRVSKDEEYSFRVEGNRSLEGRFSFVISCCTMGVIGDWQYTGKPIELPYVHLVASDYRVLKYGRDYTLSFKDNVQPGTATVTITGVGDFSGTRTTTFNIVKPPDTVSIYRMYNTKTSEHLWTTSKAEYNACGKGAYRDWRQEGVAWEAPDGEGEPVYRLYNRAMGDHYYSMNEGEIRVLTGQYGWVLDNGGKPAFWSAASGDEGAKALYHVYNARLKRGKHHFTMSVAERDFLTANAGWRYDGEAFYGFKNE